MKRRRLGSAARRRVRQGGPLATGRPAETLAGWRAVKAAVMRRAGGRCEVCRMARARDPDHVVKRSAGGSDHPDNVIAACPNCHARRDAPFNRGRLLIVPLGGGKFESCVYFARDKFELAARATATKLLAEALAAALAEP